MRYSLCILYKHWTNLVLCTWYEVNLWDSKDLEDGYGAVVLCSVVGQDLHLYRVYTQPHHYELWAGGQDQSLLQRCNLEV